MPKFDATKYPEVKALMDEGVHRIQHHWRVDGSKMSTIFEGASPLSDQQQSTLETVEEPPEPRDLFLSELADVYYAEKALEKMLPKLADEATDDRLTSGFERHLDETCKHSANLEQVFETLGQPPKAEQCPGIDGITDEHDKFMAEHDASPTIRDLFLAGAAARAEHYEIAAYTSLITMSSALGETKVTRLLEANLRDEKNALKKAESVSKRLSNGTNGARTRARTARSRTTTRAGSRSTRQTRSRG